MPDRKYDAIKAFGLPDELTLSASKLLDRAALSAKRCEPTASDFLTPAERAAFERFLPSECQTLGVEYGFSGGYPDAERVRAIFTPGWTSPDDCAADFLALARFSYSDFDRPINHRDCLGAIMALGVSREALGDILPNDVTRSADVIATPEIAAFLISSLEKAGRASLRAELLPLSDLSVPEKKLVARRDTVASLRLDSVLSSAFNISRADAADAVKRGLVSVDHIPSSKPDAELSPGTLLSLRGHGRAVLQEVAGETKKGRLSIVTARYI